MRVRMVVDVSGTRGGNATWPRRGEILECDEQEGQDLIRAGIAMAVADKPAERATAPVAEERAQAPAPAAPAAATAAKVEPESKSGSGTKR